MNRFEAASDGELQSFADNQKSLNTQRSTKTTMCLLEQYKVEAFNYTNGFETMDRNNLVKLLKSFYQKIKKSDGEPYEPGSLRTMHYGVLRLPNHPDKCPVKLFLEYSLKRPSDMKHPDTPMFLLSSRKAPSDFRKPFELNDIWYHSKAAGLNTLCKTTKTMVDILQMDVGNRKITNTSVRKMVVNTLGNKGVRRFIIVTINFFYYNLLFYKISRIIKNHQ